MREVTANKSDMPLTNKSEDSSTTIVLETAALTNLSPYTHYVITVEANTSAGYGNRSEELHVKTDPGVYMRSVLRWKLFTILASTVTV